MMILRISTAENTQDFFNKTLLNFEQKFQENPLKSGIDISVWKVLQSYAHNLFSKVHINICKPSLS